MVDMVFLNKNNMVVWYFEKKRKWPSNILKWAQNGGSGILKWKRNGVRKF